MGKIMDMVEYYEEKERLDKEIDEQLKLVMSSKTSFEEKKIAAKKHADLVEEYKGLVKYLNR